jgi:hypothetical protein
MRGGRATRAARETARFLIGTGLHAGGRPEHSRVVAVTRHNLKDPSVGRNYCCADAWGDA